jgi:hypothetical protein
MNYNLNGSYTYAVAGFAGAPAGVAPMRTPISLGSLGYGSLGIDMVTRGDIAIGLEYSRQEDSNYKQDLWSLRLSTAF